jgi:hypothetical protein
VVVTEGVQQSVVPVNAKCLGCGTIAERTGYEETASPELIWIRCPESGCRGGKRIAKIVYGATPATGATPSPAPPPAPSKEQEVDLVAEARRIFDVDETAAGGVRFPEHEAAAPEEVGAAEVVASSEERDAEAKDPASDIDAAYRAWLKTEDGGVIARAIRDRALALVRRGWRHYGIRALWEAARFDRALEVGPGEDGYKLNDHYTSRLARDLMGKYPELEGFFETRELRS